MKIFVTGGAGFIGAHVTRLLLNLGHGVVVFDNLSTGHRDAIDGRSEFIKGDLADQQATEKALSGCEAVIHLAASIEVSESVKFPVKFAENNIVNTVKLLEAAKNTGVKKIIFSSSACVYGKPQKLPITEEDPIGVQTNAYGVTKLAMEAFCTTYSQLYDFDVTILRYFNPYGPGELHDPETHAIPNFVKAVLGNKPIPLYWNGQQVRDFIYIDDLAQAHADVLPLTGLNIFNLGTETGTKVADIVRQIFEIAGREVPIDNLGERKGDVPATYASAAKIKKAVGWQPRTTLKEGLTKTVEFLKAYNL